MVLRSLKALPLIKPFLTPGGWQEVKYVYWKVSVSLKCVRTSRTDSFLNLSPLYTHVSRKVISLMTLSEIAAVKFYLLGLSTSLFPLFMFHREKTSSIYIFQVSGLKWLRFMISVSTMTMEMLAKETAIFVPIAVPCV